MMGKRQRNPKRKEARKRKPMMRIATTTIARNRRNNRKPIGRDQ